ncbi:hypothetical protein BJV77DRAFT_966073 [Russula vinacea]|nr:hypothetical protein BJV77DRAFT_966073 [Russula vinacea]
MYDPELVHTTFCVVGVTFVAHDELGGGNNASFEVGATMIIFIMNLVSVTAAIISEIFIFTAIQAQDFPDVDHAAVSITPFVDSDGRPLTDVSVFGQILDWIGFSAGPDAPLSLIVRCKHHPPQGRGPPQVYYVAKRWRFAHARGDYRSR